MIIRYGMGWQLIIGEFEILKDKEIYTLILGYVDNDFARDGLYMRIHSLSDSNQFIVGCWVSRIKNDPNYFGEKFSPEFIDECLRLANRIEKLKAFI